MGGPAISFSTEVSLFAAAAGVASFIYFQNKIDNHHSEVGDRVETLRNWRWSNLSDELGGYFRATMRDILDDLVNDLPDDTTIDKLEDVNIEERVVNMIELDHGPDRLRPVVDEFQDRADLEDSHNKIRKLHKRLRLMSGALVIGGFGAAWAFHSLLIPHWAITVLILLFVLLLDLFALAILSLVQEKMTIEDQWESYRSF